VRLLHASALLALGWSALARPAHACAPAPRPGDDVRITDEEAVIVWDAASHTEHFIRHARFDASLRGGAAARDFGFLVPTPRLPTLTEAPESIFAELADESKPQVVEEEETGPRLGCLCFGVFSRKGVATAPAPPEPVRILSTQTVAGYDAVVLEADDAKALADWLGAHGYESRPALTEWLKPYIARKWKITAFKIAAGAGGDAQARATVGTSVVRMTFSTDAPFFPYREPYDQRIDAAGPRSLRVYLVAGRRMTGSLGLAGGAWPGEVEYARPLERIVPLSRALPGEVLPSAAWLTVFLDASSPRAGSDDVYFAPSPSDGELRRPPRVIVRDRTMLVPVDVLGLALAGVVVAAFFVRGYSRGRR
jgi:Uncharacterized protein conserved in bacteria (DUF2330)